MIYEELAAGGETEKWKMEIPTKQCSAVIGKSRYRDRNTNMKKRKIRTNSKYRNVENGNSNNALH